VKRLDRFHLWGALILAALLMYFVPAQRIPICKSGQTRDCHGPESRLP